MAKFTLHGDKSHQKRSMRALFRSTCLVACQRVFGRSAMPKLKWDVEVGVHFLREQMNHAFSLPHVNESRAYLDSLQFEPLSDIKVDIQAAAADFPKGKWFLPKCITSERILYYFHGGGYAFHANSQQPMIAMIAQAAACKMFALDYRLTPEHPEPAQLEDAVAGYKRLLADGVSPDNIVIAGDSAGGHLALTLMLALKELNLPQPALVMPLCPWIDLRFAGESFHANEKFDWLQVKHVERFREWELENRAESTVSIDVMSADLNGLAPIYIQAGANEILVDMIRAFAEYAKSQGAQVNLEVFDGMPHDFQSFGDYEPQSKAALKRIGDVISALN